MQGGGQQRFVITAIYFVALCLCRAQQPPAGRVRAAAAQQAPEGQERRAGGAAAESDGGRSRPLQHRIAPPRQHSLIQFNKMHH